MFSITLDQLIIMLALIVLIFAAIILSAFAAVRHIVRYHASYKAYVDVVKADLKRTECDYKMAHQQSQFLYDMLMDLCSCDKDTDILYKAVNMRAILLLMEFNDSRTDHIQHILMNPQERYINKTLSEMMEKHQAAEILEPDTRSSYDRLMKAIYDLNEERILASESYDGSMRKIRELTPEVVNDADYTEMEDGTKLSVSNRIT